MGAKSHVRNQDPVGEMGTETERVKTRSTEDERQRPNDRKDHTDERTMRTVEKTFSDGHL